MEEFIGDIICYLGLSKHFLVIPLKHNPLKNCKNGGKLDLELKTSTLQKTKVKVERQKTDCEKIAPNHISLAKHLWKIVLQFLKGLMI